MAISSTQGEQVWLSLKEVSRITGKRPPALRREIQRKKYQRVKKLSGKYGEYWLIHKDEIGNGEGERGNPKTGGNVPGIKKGERSGEHVPGEGDHRGELVNVITIDFYEQQREKWDQEKEELRSGLMMYRYKYEDMERKLRLLPAPPEMIQEEIRRRNEIAEQARKELTKAQGELAQVREKVCEKEEVIKAEVEHRENLTFELNEKKDALGKAQEILRDAHLKNERYESSLTELQQKLQEEEQAKEALLEEMKKERARSWWKRLLGIK